MDRVGRQRRNICCTTTGSLQKGLVTGFISIWI